MKKGIILTSFGTTYKETLKKNIETLEKLVEENYPDYLVLRAFTSRIVAKRLKARGYEVDNPTQALEKMKDQGIREIYIQPSLIIEGHEYEKLQREVREFLERNEEEDYKIEVGLPLLSSEEDYQATVTAMELRNCHEEEAIIYMGHGSDHVADMAYEKLDKIISDRGYKNIYVATVEGAIEIDHIIEKMDKKIKTVELRPFMLVAGDHATNDMASDEEDSWKSILKKHGIKANPKLVGLGELDGIRKIFLSHLKDIID